MRKKKELTETEKRDLAMKYEVAEELGLLEKVERLEGANIERKRTHRRHYGDKKNGGAKADRSGQSGQSGHLKGQGVDRQWTGVWTAERHFLSIRIPACI